jgi:hypothetical protein
LLSGRRHGGGRGDVSPTRIQCQIGMRHLGIPQQLNRSERSFRLLLRDPAL